MHIPRASKSQQPPLVWRKFSGFEAIPSQHTDHFIGTCIDNFDVIIYTYILIYIYEYVYMDICI